MIEASRSDVRDHPRTTAARCGACGQRLEGGRAVACERCHTAYHRRCARQASTCGPRDCPPRGSTRRPASRDRFRISERRRRELQAQVRQEETRRLRRRALEWDAQAEAAAREGAFEAHYQLELRRYKVGLAVLGVWAIYQLTLREATLETAAGGLLVALVFYVSWVCLVSD